MLFSWTLLGSHRNGLLVRQQARCLPRPGFLLHRVTSPRACDRPLCSCSHLRALGTGCIAGAARPGTSSPKQSGASLLRVLLSLGFSFLVVTTTQFLEDRFKGSLILVKNYKDLCIVFPYYTSIMKFLKIPPFA